MRSRFLHWLLILSLLWTAGGTATAPYLVCRMSGGIMPVEVVTPEVEPSGPSCCLAKITRQTDGTCSLVLVNPSCCDLRPGSEYPSPDAVSFTPSPVALPVVAFFVPLPPMARVIVPLYRPAFDATIPRGPPLTAAPPRAPPHFS